MGLRTVTEARTYYNKWSEYESVLEGLGYATAMQVVEILMPYLGANKKMLDVGCGTGLIGSELERCGHKGNLFGVDIAEERLREASRKRIYSGGVQTSAYALPFRSGSFDVVVSNGMVGLAGIKSVQEMFRVLKPGGQLACVVVEIKGAQWSRARFRKVCGYFRQLSKAKARILLRRDLGTGYADTTYKDEHHVCFLLRKN